jgi:hypothetical protein
MLSREKRFTKWNVNRGIFDAIFEDAVNVKEALGPIIAQQGAPGNADMNTGCNLLHKRLSLRR